MNSYNINKRAKANEFWESRRAEMERLYFSRGFSQQEIGALFGLSQSAIYKWMKRLGIKAKSRGRSGAENGRYIDGTESRLYRQMVRIEKCEKCSSENDLLVHHKNDDHLDNAPSNLQVLCRPCHFSHHKTEWWRKRKAEMKASAGAN